MAAQPNAPVIVVKRKKIVVAGGHHGGAWKVAYADFVTAMMAFFLLMWLLGATTEKQRKSIADYFNPTIPLVKASGGGTGAFGGDNMFSSNSLSQQGSGAALSMPTEARNARGSTGSDEQDAEEAAANAGSGKALREDESLEQVQTALLGIGGESMNDELMRRHIVTRLSDEGLVIELFDTPEAPLFDADDGPTETLERILDSVIPMLRLVDNDIAVQAHVRSVPIVIRENPTWMQTSGRAQALRETLGGLGLDERRIVRVTGFADRQPATRNPMDPRNDRVEIVVLRRLG